MAVVKPFRAELIKELGECVACGKKRALSCHEILNGPLRCKTLDEPCSLLVLCYWCNSNEFTDKAKWPVARQLALLKKKMPQYYDLERFNFIRNPDAPRYIEQHEVDAYANTV